MVPFTSRSDLRQLERLSENSEVEVQWGLHPFFACHPFSFAVPFIAWLAAGHQPILRVLMRGRGTQPASSCYESGTLFLFALGFDSWAGSKRFPSVLPVLLSMRSPRRA